MRNPLVEMIGLEDTQEDMLQPRDTQIGAIEGVRIGKLISVEETGQILVDYPHNLFGALPARSTVNIPNREIDREVLLVFEDGDPQLPIIVGIVQDQPVVTPPSKEVTLDEKNIKDIIVDGERIVFDAKKEIVLRCGKGSVTIRADGKIVIRGTNLLSRSRGMNKIKGAAVSIN